MDSARHTLITCRAACDARLSVAGSSEHPAAVLVSHDEPGLRILAIGQLETVGRHPAAAAARRLDLPDDIVIPGLINAHTHLDLTVIGPQPHEPSDGFVAWVNRIRAHRPAESDQIAASVHAGVRLSRAGGVVAVGDIAGAVRGSASLLAADALRDTGMAGVSFVEFFAIGAGAAERAQHAIELVRDNHHRFTGRHRLGIQPHATNTVSLAAYAHALAAAHDLGLPAMTHLAESPEERRFVAEAQGPQRKLLEDLGLWTDDIAEEFGRGRSPIEHLAATLAESRIAAVHVNQCSDVDLELLVQNQTPVVYCPRASAYFGAEHHFGPHRYRDMLAAGLTVAVGTDSIVNLPAGTDRISPLDEIRFLHARDGTDPMTLLEMATLHAARALGIDDRAVRIAPEAAPLGLVAVPAPPGDFSRPADAIARSDSAPRIVLE